VKAAVLVDANTACWFDDAYMRKFVDERKKEDTVKARAEHLAQYYQSANLPKTVALIRTVAFPSTIPIIDLVSEYPPFSDSSDNTRWRNCHKQFVAGQPHREGITAYGTTHYVFQDNPPLVIQAIAKVYAGAVGEPAASAILTRDQGYAMTALNDMMRRQTPNQPMSARGARGESMPDDSTGRRVDSLVSAELRAQHIPGIAIGVMRDGRVIKATGYGFANIELEAPVTPETIFQTGSVGKQFTATAIMMLVESGKLSLDDSLTRFFPEGTSTWRGITIRQVLTHTSGIPDYGGEEDTMGKGVIDFRRDYTEDELIQHFSKLPLDFTPGSQWRYSNTGYVILGVLIHRITGQFYGDFLHDRIFVPLGMTATRIISEADIVPHRSNGYRLVDGEIKNQQWVAPSLNTTADGALYTNVFDMAKWDSALYTNRLLRPESFAQMWTPVRLNNGTTHPYGFGWGVTTVNGHRLIAHSGAWQGFTMAISRYIDDRLSVVVFTNLDEDNSHPARIASGIARLYLPWLTPTS
jgi:CubicO group peptidase (beta-lactamase class C family)